MFTRLLVGLDGSPGAEAALTAAIELGRRFHSAILLAAIADVRLLEAPILGGAAAPWAEGAIPVADIGDLGRVLEERSGRLLADGASRVREAGLPCETVRATGLVDEELIALGARAEAIVIGRRGELHRDPGTLGTVAAHVVRKSPRPVMIAGERPSRCEKPLVAWDGGTTSSAALAVAARYAAAIQVPIDVVTVSDDPGCGEELLARAGAFLSGEHVPFTTHVLAGDVAKAIAAHVERTGADLLLAGAHGGRHGRPSWSIGSHAEKLIRATTIPVIINR